MPQGCGDLPASREPEPPDQGAPPRSRRLENGKVVNATTAIFSLGGATLDNEWNHIQQKVMRGLGIVAIENQARI